MIDRPPRKFEHLVVGETRVSGWRTVSEEEIVRAFLAWAWEIEGNRTLAGQNVSFDRDYLKEASARAGLDWDLAHRTIDKQYF